MTLKIENAKERLMACGKKYLLANDHGQFGRIGIRQLTTECGMALGTFYRYFVSKDDLVMKIMEKDWEDAVKSIDATIASDTPMYDKVKGVYEEIGTFDRNYYYSAMRMFNPTEEAVAFKKKNEAMMYDKIQALLEEEIQKGKLILDADPKDAAYFLIQIFLACARRDDITFEELWKCMTFRLTDEEKKPAEEG